MLTDYTTGKHLTKREFDAALKPASMLAIRSYDVLLLRRVLVTWVVRDICEWRRRVRCGSRWLVEWTYETQSIHGVLNFDDGGLRCSIALGWE